MPSCAQWCLDEVVRLTAVGTVPEWLGCVITSSVTGFPFHPDPRVRPGHPKTAWHSKRNVSGKTNFSFGADFPSRADCAAGVKFTVGAIAETAMEVETV
jgi:hypothetical protein